MLGYTIGSFPTGFLLLKWRRKIDIRMSGSGNVGAMNAYEVTGSRTLGALTMAIDLLKGMLAVMICRSFVTTDITLIGLTGVSAILGHNYPVWLRGKGGRGLATGAGVMLLLGWIFVAAWSLLWLGWYAITKQIHLANIAATVISPVTMLFVPPGFVNVLLPAYTGTYYFMATVSLVAAVILIAHIKPIRELWQRTQK